MRTSSQASTSGSSQQRSTSSTLRPSSSASSSSCSYLDNKERSSMIAHQRSDALYESVLQGELSVEAILAFPIDWQGIAVEEQYNKRNHSRIILEEKERIPSKSPLQIKRAEKIRPSHKDRVDSIQMDESALGLNLYGDTLNSYRSSSFTLSANSSCPPSPSLTYSGCSTSQSDDESIASSPTMLSPYPYSNTNICSLPQDDAFYQSKPTLSQFILQLQASAASTSTSNFPLKSYCSAFNDVDVDQDVAYPSVY